LRIDRPSAALEPQERLATAATENPMDTEGPLQRHPTSSSGSPERRCVTILATLLLTTLAAGAAIRQPSAGPQPPPGPADLRFQAPGAGPVHFSGRLDRGSVLSGGDGLVRMELVLRGDELPGERPRVPTDLVVLLDRSGSMQGAPLQHAKQAVRALMGQLASEDRFALVSYASDVRLEWRPDHPSPTQRAHWTSTLEAIPAQGGTNMAIGIDLANQTISASRDEGRAARVVLLSDGHANEGDHSLAGLRGRAAMAVKGEYVLSTAGVGQGFDEALMTALADAGAGNFYYVEHSEDLAGVFAGEFAAARETVASSVAVVIRPADGIEIVDAAGYPLERRGAEVRFHPGDLFAGQERRIWLTLRAPTTTEGGIDLGRFAVSYTAAGQRAERAFERIPRVSCVKNEDDYFAAMEPEVRARSIVVDEVNALKQQVSAAVQAGDRAQAAEYLEAFRREKERENLVLQSEEVEDTLQSLRSVESAVDAAFEASPSVARELQNSLGKSLNAEGYDGRRVGAKR
jgi:Ca-activated chloride channel family protein